MDHRHTHDLSAWQHEHVFDRGNLGGERGAWRVVTLTTAMMVVEIGAGWWTNSMALLADGWHMATHALALGLTATAYALARRWARDARFAFGTWKVEILASFASALLLLVVAALLAVESLARLFRPVAIGYEEALAVAAAGLVVNLVSAWMLREGHDHGHGPGRGSGHGHDDAAGNGPAGGHRHAAGPDRATGHDHPGVHHHAPHHDRHPDLNLRSAYLHVLTDALTSVLAIVALAGGLLWGWGWLDPAMAIVGSAVIAHWAWGLLRQSGTVLLDREMDHPIVEWAKQAIECDGDARVADLHVWRVGRNQFACVACLVADAPLAPSVYQDRLRAHPAIVHVTIEANACESPGERSSPRRDERS